MGKGRVNIVRVEGVVVRINRDGWVDGENNGRRGFNVFVRCLDGWYFLLDEIKKDGGLEGRFKFIRLCWDLEEMLGN